MNTSFSPNCILYIMAASDQRSRGLVNKVSSQCMWFASLTCLMQCSLQVTVLASVLALPQQPQNGGTEVQV